MYRIKHSGRNSFCFYSGTEFADDEGLGEDLDEV
jgi:hypothetical protein